MVIRPGVGTGLPSGDFSCSMASKEEMKGLLCVINHLWREDMEQHFPRIHPKVAAFAQRQYYPIIDDGILELTRKHSWKHLPLVCTDAPGQLSGSALRIGYTGTQDMDLAIYRLKPRGAGDRAFMLPFLYILQDGIFIPYEQ